MINEKVKALGAIFFFASCKKKKALGLLVFSLSSRPSGVNKVLKEISGISERKKILMRDLVIIFFPGTDYSLVRQEILYGKVCLQIRLLFSLHSAHCSIDSGVGGPDFHQVSATQCQSGFWNL